MDERSWKETDILVAELGNLGKGWDDWFGLSWICLMEQEKQEKMNYQHICFVSNYLIDSINF